jgi:hypothetical protein
LPNEKRLPASAQIGPLEWYDDLGGDRPTGRKCVDFVSAQSVFQND